MAMGGVLAQAHVGDEHELGCGGRCFERMQRLLDQQQEQIKSLKGEMAQAKKRAATADDPQTAYAADMAVFPWYGALAKGWQYGAAEFLSVQDYKNVQRWADTILARPAVKRGRMVNRTSGEPSEQLRERHDASDFDTRTQDKLVAA